MSLLLAPMQKAQGARAVPLDAGIIFRVPANFKKCGGTGDDRDTGKPVVDQASVEKLAAIFSAVFSIAPFSL